MRDLVSTQTFTYDNLGQMISKERTIDGQTYVTETEYDAMGRELAVTYPNGDVVRSTYTGPFLTSVNNSSNTVAYGAFTYHPTAVGKPFTLSLGNGVITTYIYTNSTFLLTGVDTRGPSNDVLQDFEYSYDNAKNITQIAANGSNQNFAYDDLNRLTQAVGPYGTQNYSYDRVGNILSNPDNAEPLPGYLSGENWVSSTGTVQQANGRLGQGMSFDGTGQARLINSEKTMPSAGITVDLWVRPIALDGPAIVSKGGSFSFARLLSSGSAEAKLSLSSGEKTVVLSSGSVRYNLWQHLAMTYDGANIKVYVNGQLKATQAATGLILPSSAPIYIGGTGFQGMIDEVNIQSWALAASEILARYQSMPNFPPSQPKTPESVPGGITTGQQGVLHKFKFLAWDLDGDSIKYRINWGDGNIQDTGFVPSGSAVEASHAWSQSQTYAITAQAVQLSSSGAEVISATSPAYNFFVDTATYSTLLSTPLTNAVAVISYSSSHTAEIILGEPVVSTSSSSQYKVYLGYQERITDESLWWSVTFGSEGQGGTDPNPTDPVSVSSFIDLTAANAQEVAAIAAGLRQNPTAQSSDANGNMRIARGRWIQYDYDNRPVKVITMDGSVTEFAYDFEGSRVNKVIMREGTTEMTHFIGTIYEITGSESIVYIHAGAKRIALRKETGELEYFLPDHLGGTNLITNTSGTVIRTTKYMPYGSTYETSGTDDNDHKYTAQRLDDTTGLYYYGARYYDPSSGKFISPDSIVQATMDPQSLDRYAYVRNNPIVNIDPSGYSWLSEFVEDNSFEIGLGLQAANWMVTGGFGTALLSQSEKGRNVLAAEIVVVTAFATAYCGGCGAAATWGALAGEVAGGYSAYESDGDILSGVAVGGAIGGLTGQLGYMAGGSIKASLGFTRIAHIAGGAARGAIVGVGSGGVAGFRGGKGNIGSIGIGALQGGILGAVAGGIFGNYEYSTPSSARGLGQYKPKEWYDGIKGAVDEGIQKTGAAGVKPTINSLTANIVDSLWNHFKAATIVTAVRNPEFSYGLISAGIGVERTMNYIPSYIHRSLDDGIYYGKTYDLK